MDLRSGPLTPERVLLLLPPRRRWKRAANVVRRRLGLAELHDPLWLEAQEGGTLKIRWTASGRFVIE